MKREIFGAKENDQSPKHSIMSTAGGIGTLHKQLPWNCKWLSLTSNLSWNIADQVRDCKMLKLVVPILTISSP